MQTKQFRAFLTQTEALTPQQRKQTLEHIQKHCDITTVTTVLNSVESCPHCDSTDVSMPAYRDTSAKVAIKHSMP